MKNSLKLILGFVLLTGLSACVETKEAVCTDTNKTDIATLAGEYTASILFDPEIEISQNVFKIARLENGKYTFENPDNGKFTMSICQIGKMKVAEALTAHGTYQQYVIAKGAEGTVSLHNWIIDQKTLRAGNVPFQIIERPVETLMDIKSLISVFSDTETQKVLVIDNSSKSAQEYLSEKASASAIGLMLQ